MACIFTCQFTLDNSSSGVTSAEKASLTDKPTRATWSSTLDRGYTVCVGRASHVVITLTNMRRDVGYTPTANRQIDGISFIQHVHTLEHLRHAHGSDDFLGLCVNLYPQ